MIKNKNRLLSIQYPAICKEWHYDKNGLLTPSDVSYGSHKKVWWTCKLGHSWLASICDRTISKSGCPFCSGRLPSNKNNLAVKNPQLAKEWHPTKNNKLMPYHVTVSSHKKVYWQCKMNHVWIATVNSRNDGNNCPYCSNKMVDKQNCLKTTHPQLAKEWHPTKNGKLTPYDVTKSSGKKVWWQCEKLHEWETKINTRESHKSQCAKCFHVEYLKKNSMAIRDVELAKEWDQTRNGKLTPHDFTFSCNQKVWWKCACGHSWLAAINNRHNGQGCPLCATNKVKLKDGTICDSMVEAYFYLSFKNSKINFDHHGIYPLIKYKDKRSRKIYDFYLTDENTYIEITSFDKNFDHWEYYYKNIKNKKKHVEDVIGANFEFIQKKLTRKEKDFVRSYMVYSV